MEFIKYIKNSFVIYKLNNSIIKYISLLSIFAITVFFTPNFNIVSFPIFLLSSLTIILLDSLISTIFNINSVTLNKGIIGFCNYAIIIYITQFLVKGYYISFISTIIASMIYGIIVSITKN